MQNTFYCLKMIPAITYYHQSNGLLILEGMGITRPMLNILYAMVTREGNCANGNKLSCADIKNIEC